MTVPRSHRPVVEPLAPETYKVQFTISRDTHDKLRRAQDLLRHSIPDGDPAKIFAEALTVLLAEVEKKKLAAAAKPREAQQSTRQTRHIPARIRRQVWKRDGGKDTFVGGAGKCGETAFLEFHHRMPFAAGGPTTAENLELGCHAYEIRGDSGRTELMPKRGCSGRIESSAGR